MGRRTVPPTRGRNGGGRPAHQSWRPFGLTAGMHRMLPEAQRRIGTSRTAAVLNGLCTVVRGAAGVAAPLSLRPGRGSRGTRPCPSDPSGCRGLTVAVGRKHAPSPVRMTRSALRPVAPAGRGEWAGRAPGKPAGGHRHHRGAGRPAAPRRAKRGPSPAPFPSPLLAQFDEPERIGARRGHMPRWVPGHVPRGHARLRGLHEVRLRAGRPRRRHRLTGPCPPALPRRHGRRVHGAVADPVGPTRVRRLPGDPAGRKG